MSGKGDRQRPVDKETYDQNYDEIDWSSTRKKSNENNKATDKKSK